MFTRNIYYFRSIIRELNRFSRHNNNENIIKDNFKSIFNYSFVLNSNEINDYNQQIRYYAKNKDKKKDKNKKTIKIEINETQLRDNINLDGLNKQMNYFIEQMKDEFIKNLSLRSTTGSIEQLKIHLNGIEHELQELAQISRKNPKTIVINMIAFPQTIPDVLKAIEKSGMNLNPQQDGTTLFIPIPKITKEHRENLSKNAKIIFIRCRDNIKDVQNNTIKKIKKQTDLSKDDAFNIQNQIIAIADKFITEAETILNTKQNELIVSEKD